MLLVIDIGNTNINIGIFDKEVLVESVKYDSDKNLSADEYAVFMREIFLKHKIEGCIIGSVAEELNLKLKTACDDVFGINSIIFNNELNTGLKLDVKFPQKVGADRVANAYGAI